ncbi:MAG: sugar isomerase [Planctomycetes bacterium]|nr:sugar isomerase [Planctomycetota bacterium]
MNLLEEKYTPYALCHEMLETVSVISSFDPACADIVEPLVGKGYDSILLTGEGSSRIFPAKNAISTSLNSQPHLRPFTEGSTQALDYNLSKSLVLGASNSGKTKEVIRLFHRLREQGHGGLVGLSAHGETPLGELCDATHVLNCGGEKAVAATKSVVEQALFVMALMSQIGGKAMPSLDGLDHSVGQALTQSIKNELVQKAAAAPTLYFSGRNDGVAEELTLKTNEITRKKSDFLEGTYGVHGIEEVMLKEDVVILIDPFESEEEKIATCLEQGVGMSVFAISHRPTRFPTMLIPDAGPWNTVVQLCAGWNLLVEIGLHLGINLDKPERARKVGNEYVPA